MGTTYHVDPRGDDHHAGDAAHPFQSISRAASCAVAGDRVVVHQGVYRESVDPRNGGGSDIDRIVYEGAANESKPVIKGSERIDDWTPVEGHDGVWRAVIDNGMFGSFNPFAAEISGDWLVAPDRRSEPAKHLGDVYLNGRSFYEASSLETVYHPVRRDTVEDNALHVSCPIAEPDTTLYVWFAQVNETSNTTTIWANFQQHDPNAELVEISVRRTCFFPSRNHVNFITVRGFEMAQAATDWAPPTSAQYGMVGPNWALGWIIEDNVLHDAKFSAVSLGKEISTGDNEWTKTERKSGYQYQLEAVFKAKRVGWERGVVGSHIVRGNHIYDCGQNAIVGHMGCAFSTIVGNRIHDIGLKREFFGWEVAGIKFHAALDTVIEGNDVHDCSLGLWLDWQAQGTRLTRNVFHHNVRDLMVEVSHGPYVVDNNIFASPIMIQNFAQGGAFVNNLICGSIDLVTVPDRSTPYHFPHSTDVAGTAIVSGGDERFSGNIFAPQAEKPPFGAFGLESYRGYPQSMPEYIENLHRSYAQSTQGGGERNPVQPLYAWNNVHVAPARVSPNESAPVAIEQRMPLTIVDQGDVVYLECDVPEALAGLTFPVVTTSDLGMPRIVEEPYEQADGTPYRFDTDMLGERVEESRRPGPLASLAEGRQRIAVWARPTSSSC